MLMVITIAFSSAILPLRFLCAEKFPTALPKVLQSVTWHNRSDVSQVQHLPVTDFHTSVLKYI